ncbi:MAG: leucine-rich repeat protein [Clostridia bacterium]|nr:leucine-rich repeat protein [Clostridia bacterium]
MMKKWISLFLCLALFSSLFAIPNVMAENAPVIVVDTVTANPGETVKVNIALQNNPGIVSMTLRASYDSTVLTLTNVEDGGILGTQSHKPQYSSPYTLAWVNDTATTNFTANGVIATLEFAVNESAIVGENYPITIYYDSDNYDIYNKDVECVDFSIINGSVSIIPEETQPTPTPLSDFSYRIENGNICITGYHGNDTKLFLAETYEVNGEEKTVIKIDESAFEGNEGITSISLPATIQTICDYAFYDCTSLTDVTLWSKYAAIGEQAFGYYYISRKVDGKVDGFVLTSYSGSTAEEYLSENDLSFIRQEKPVGIGDINADGEYSSQDLVTISQHLLSVVSLENYNFIAADLNNDGVINIIDLVKLKKKLIAL